jgi:hypothetical protein
MNSPSPCNSIDANNFLFRFFAVHSPISSPLLGNELPMPSQEYDSEASSQNTEERFMSAVSIGSFVASTEGPLVGCVPDSSLAVSKATQAILVPSSVTWSSYNSLSNCLLRCGASFYRAVSAASEKGDWITFEEAMPGTSLKQLYVRESYRKLSSQMLAGVRDKFVVTGTPGIGKSVFLFFLLFELVKLRKKCFWFSILILFTLTGKVVSSS